MRVYGNLDSINTQGRNLLINGDFQIDQRNAGAAKTINAASWVYTVDRWCAYGQSTDGVFTVQQVTTSVPPSGAAYALKLTTTTADASIGAAQAYIIGQIFEGNITAKLLWGTANAKPITLSFWVRASVAGTYSGAYRNIANTRSYPFTFVINAVDTWEYKTVTIPGCTDGTWLGATTGASGYMDFDLGVGTTYRGTAGAWAAGNYTGVTGSVSLISTINATMYLADVQIEEGKEATAFERLHTDDVIRKCQRYYRKTYDINVVPGTAVTAGSLATCFTNTAGYAITTFKLDQPMRANPICNYYSISTGASGKCYNGSSGDVNVYVINESAASVIVRSEAGTANSGCYFHITAESEL